MELFLDTANLDEIKEIATWGIVTGVTTNPSLIAREQGVDFKSVVTEICSIIDGPVSAEVTALDTKSMIAEARKISRWHKNIVIKIPITEAGLGAISILEKEGIHTNATLCFSSNQALLVARAGASFVSPFVGRLDDIGQNGMNVVEEIVAVYDSFCVETKVISASIRHPQHVIASALAGADIATVPYKVLKSMVKHPLTDKGIELFLKDWESVKKSNK